MNYDAVCGLRPTSTTRTTSPAGRRYQITLGAGAPLDPIVHDGMPHLDREFTDSLDRGENPLDAIRDPEFVLDWLAATWLEENPDMDFDLMNREDDCFAGKYNTYLISLVKWMKIKPGPRDRGPLTLLEYLRHAVLETGGFPGFYQNAAFEPLRRELVEGLEPF